MGSCQGSITRGLLRVGIGVRLVVSYSPHYEGPCPLATDAYIDCRVVRFRVRYPESSVYFSPKSYLLGSLM